MAGRVYFDIESHSARRLYSHTGPGPYVKLCGVMVDDNPAVGITTDPQRLLRVLERAVEIDGHNIIKFDLAALAEHEGADYAALCAKAVDTLVLERLADPPGSRNQKPWSVRGYYSMDQVCIRRGLVHKTDDLAALARRYVPAGTTGPDGKVLSDDERAEAGYGLIPADDPDYIAYLRGDMGATRALRDSYGEISAYARREMRVVFLQNQMTRSGWRVDEALLKERVAREDARRLEATDHLAGRGMPVTKEVGHGRGKARVTAEEAVASPLSTNAGRDWLLGVWQQYGVREGSGVYNIPRTPKGVVATGKERLVPFLEHPGCPAGLKEVLGWVMDFTGATAKYAEISRFVRDGRVHAEVGGDQASGRWAMVKPSTTNLGKRGPKLAERGVFLPDEGHVLIACDLDQVDMRAIAALCQDRAYMELFGPGRDAHAENALRVFHRSDGESRDRAKKIGHLWNYGGGVGAIVKAGASKDDAIAYDRAMLRSYPGLCEWREDIRAKGEHQLLDNGFGRMMRCDPGRAYTQAPALMGQGGARDLMTTGMLRLADAVPEAVAWFRGVVHDEIVMSVPEKHAVEIGREVQKAFTFEWRGVPITSGISLPGRDWADCYRKAA